MDIHHSEQEKLKLEHEEAKFFMRAYERQTGSSIRHLWHNRPDKPDTSCLLEGERLDLEIAHLYGSEVEAMTFLGRDTNDETIKSLQSLAATSTSQERLLEALNRILENKSKKIYKSKRVWLVIRNMHPEWNAQLIEAAKESIVVPLSHGFDRIWIVGDIHGKSGVVRLD